MKKYIQLYFILILLFVGCMTGCSRMSTPDFQHLNLSSAPNFYLACPDKYCNITPNALSPVYPVPADELYNLFTQIIAKSPNVIFVYSIPDQGQFGLTAYTSIFQIPDDIAVQFIALSDNTSTIAILSKSRYLYYDFGLNQHRAEEWLAELKIAAQQDIIQK